MEQKAKVPVQPGAIVVSAKRALTPAEMKGRKGQYPSPQAEAGFKRMQTPGVPHPRKPKTLLARVREILKTPRTDSRPGSRFDKAAEAYVEAMEGGSFIHLKEYIDREEGKVPTRLANADGDNLKLYGSLPLEGPEAP